MHIMTVMRSKRTRQPPTATPVTSSTVTQLSSICFSDTSGGGDASEGDDCSVPVGDVGGDSVDAVVVTHSGFRGSPSSLLQLIYSLEPLEALITSTALILNWLLRIKMSLEPTAVIEPGLSLLNTESLMVSLSVCSKLRPFSGI